MEETQLTGEFERANDTDHVPKEFGRYRIEQELGRGGMGAVYLAHDGQLDRKVAIKIPFFRGDDDPHAVERFRREARAMATVQHANLCPVYDVGRFEKWHFLTMAYIEGQSLTERLREGTLSAAASAILLRAVALAVEKAHQAGIIHRDLKPSNIMLNSEFQPIVMDFGLARRQSAGEVDITKSTAVLGSPSYMAPEQVEAKHDEVGPATDVYAMGVVLYQMVTGRRPFHGSMASILGQVVACDPEPPSNFCSGLPPMIDAICLKALEKQPSDRHASAAEFAEDLSRYLGDAKDLSSTATMSAARQPELAEAPARSASGGKDASSIRRSRDAERRHVTVMICNCDAIATEESLASLDPEDQRDLFDAFRRLCADLTDRFGGTLVQSTGQELLICYGYPTAYEDAAQRAVRTGLNILDEMELLNQRLQAQRKPPLSAWAAIHTGMVVAEESSVSESQVDTLSIIGEARTVTSRLEALTEPDQLVISDATHRLVEGFFVCESQGKQRIRGVSKPVELFRVLEEGAARSRVELIDPANLTPLVGRDMELGILKDRWEHAVEGMGQVVLLIGDAGLGKSRLVREIKEHLAEERRDAPPHVIEWRCSAHHEGSSLFPATEFLEHLLGFSRGDSPGERLEKLFRHLREFNLHAPEPMAIFASLLSLPPDERCAPVEFSPLRQKERTQELLMEWLREYAAVQPVLFIVEDLHWADPTTLEFLESHVDHGLHDSILTLLSFRSEFRTPWKSYSHMTQVALTRLTRRQIGEMIRRKTGIKNISEQIIAKLADRTDGVPLFVEEFTQMVEESGALDTGKEGGEITLAFDAIPVTLHDLLAARLDRLDSDPDVAQLGATIGREFSYELLQAAADLAEGELLAELTKLVEAELLFQKGRPPESTYIFKHALIQDAAYNSLLKQKRQQFHKRIAKTLENDFPQTVTTQPELLAHHYTEADELGVAADYWLKAGQHAQQRSANPEAINHLTRGLQVLQTLEASPTRDQLELGYQLTLAPVLMAARGWSAPEVGTAIERAQRLVSRFGTVEDQFFVMWGLWGWRIIRADMLICSKIADGIMQLVERSQEGNGLLSEAHWVVGCTAYYKGDFADGLKLLEKGFELVDADKERGYALKTGQCCSVMCHSHTALALWQLGFPEQALQRAAETVRLGKKLNHPFSYAMALFFSRQVLDFCGRRDQARERIEEEYQVCHEHGFVFFEVHAVWGRADRLLREGKVDEARELLDQGLQMLHAIGGNLSMDHPYRNIAESFLLAGLFDDADQWLNRGFDLVNNHGERGMESEFLRLQGELRLARGDRTSAEASYHRAVEVARQQEAKSWELRAMTSYAGLKQLQGNRREARQRLAPLYEWFQEGHDTSDLARAKSLLDQLEAEA